MKKALLVIDMQNEMIGEKHAPQFDYNAETLLQSVNEVIDVNKSNMVVYIKHITKKNLINKFASFHTYEGTENAELVPTFILFLIMFFQNTKEMLFPIHNFKIY